MNLIVVEDTKTVRSMLVALLEEPGRNKVVLAVESVEEALEFLANDCADLVILDLCLPGLSYDLAVKALKNVSPDLDIMVFTVSEEDDKVFSALKAGATGYILKSAKHAEVLAAVDEIEAGGSPMSPSIARKVLREFQAPAIHEEMKEIISPLSARETEILDLLYRGLNITQLADQLYLSPHTVQTHIKKIYAKLHVNSRSQAIYEAVQKNLILGAR
jgi:DNA-binding NarL/FixJ family response regulator